MPVPSVGRGAGSGQHLLTSSPSIALHRGDYDAYFTDEAAEAQRGEGTATQPVVAEPGLEPRGVVTLKTKFSPTLQAAVLIEESRGGMSVCLSVSVCLCTRVHVCMAMVLSLPEISIPGRLPGGGEVYWSPKGKVLSARLGDLDFNKCFLSRGEA